MDVKQAIEQRRAYRSLEPVTITEELVNDLAKHAQLAPSCFNNQPWRFIFIYEPTLMNRMHEVFSKGNEWAFAASMYIVVLSKKEFDCMTKDNREYFLFDTGMAVAFLLLRATELGLVAHPISGYSQRKTREILGIPDDLQVVTLINVGKHANTASPVLSADQIQSEKKRPERFSLERFVSPNRFSQELNQK